MLGQGGMATVWRAEDTLMRRPVALKVLADNLVGSPEAEHRFLREARAAYSLDHPGAVAVYDVGKAAGHLYIAFACIDGETVSSHAARTPYEDDAARALGIAVADVLDHAHSKGIVHRDITGRNIMVDREGRAFVLDFGLAWMAGSVRLTSTNATLGTYAYMAPEVAAGFTADERSDLYGLGVVLYEALTGTLPFHGESPGAILYALIHTLPEPPTRRRPSVGPALEHVVLRLLEKQPALRFQTASDLAAALRDLSPSAAVAPVDPGAVSAVGSPATATGQGPGERDLRLPDAIYLAVLPFAYHGGPGEDPDGTRGVFAKGLAGALSAALGQHPGIHIVPVPARLPDNPEGDLEGLARALGANLILRGTVRRSGIQLRVSYGLVHPYRRLQVAGNTLDGSVVELFDLEDRLVTSVVRALGLETTSDVMLLRPGIRDPAAHEHFVQALGYLQRYEDEAHVDAALGLLERLAASEPDSAPIQATIGRACLFKYRLTAERRWEARAAAACQSAIELDAASPEVLLTLGDLGVSTGQYRDAIQKYRRALELRGGLHEALIGAARAYEGLGQFADAERCCRDAIALGPEYWAGHNELGLLLFRQGRFEASLEPWRRVVALAPDNYRGHQNLGTAYFNLGRFEEALDWSQRSLDIRPSAPAHSNVGTILFYLGRYDEAARAYKKAIALRPSDPFLWGNFGSACVWVPELRQEAEEALHQAITLIRDRLGRNPNQARDWIELACWQANLGCSAEAKEALARGLATGGDDATTMARAGIICEQGGDRAGAMRYLREAVRKGYEMTLLAREPYLAALRAGPEFVELSKESPGVSRGQEPAETKHPSPKEAGREATLEP